MEIEKTYDGKIPLTLCRLTEDGRERLGAYRERLSGVLDRLPSAPGGSAAT